MSEPTLFAAINQTQAGWFISIYSAKAQVWVRLLNRYGSHKAAEDAIKAYGWTLSREVVPHTRDLRGPR